jgi:hypothetical protein
MRDGQLNAIPVQDSTAGRRNLYLCLMLMLRLETPLCSLNHLYEGRAGKEADPGGKPKQEKESAPQKEIPLRRAICAEARVTTIGTH